MSRYTARTGFDHDAKTYRAGEPVEVSEATAKELSARGLIDGYTGEKDAPKHENKMQPNPNDPLAGSVSGAGNRAGDVLAGEESVSVDTRGESTAKPRSTK